MPGFYDISGEYGLDEEFPELSSPNARGAVVFVGGTGDGLESVSTVGDFNNDGEQIL